MVRAFSEPVAQPVEHLTFNQGVAGSNPAGLTRKTQDLAEIDRSAQKASVAEDRVRAAFDIDMAALIAERGADHSFIRMAPVPCPRCGSRDTEYRRSTPPR